MTGRPGPATAHPVTAQQLEGRRCIPCGHYFRPGDTAVVHGTVGGGPVYRHEQCPQHQETPR